MKKGKVWGTTKTLLVTPFIEVHEIEINPESYCSVHKHNFKWNGFYCIEGTVDIIIKKNDYDLTDTTTLNKHEFTTVAPGEFHQFRTNNLPAKVLEIYYPEPLSEDIIRQTVGGKC